LFCGGSEAAIAQRNWGYAESLFRATYFDISISQILLIDNTTGALLLTVRSKLSRARPQRSCGSFRSFLISDH